jgi:hypothetical protein
MIDGGRITDAESKQIFDVLKEPSLMRDYKIRKAITAIEAKYDGEIKITVQG